MQSQVRNNRKIVRTTPAFSNTIYVINRSLIAMTTIDINSSAEQVCSTECARRHSRKIKEHATWLLRSSSKVSTYSALAIPWRLIHLPPSPDYYKTRPLIVNSAIFFAYSAGSVLSYYQLSFFFDYIMTTILHMYTTRSNNNTQGSSMRQKEGKAQIFQITRRLFLWRAHLKDWSGTTIMPTPTRPPTRIWCCQSGCKT